MTQSVSNDISKLSYGSFYMGQTKEDVVKNNGDVSLFDKIDGLDGSVTGTLSESDLLIHRENEAEKSQTFSNFAAAGAVAAGFAGGPIGWALCGVCALFSLYGMYDSARINSETEKYLNEAN